MKVKIQFVFLSKNSTPKAIHSIILLTFYSIYTIHYRRCFLIFIFYYAHLHSLAYTCQRKRPGNGTIWGSTRRRSASATKRLINCSRWGRKKKLRRKKRLGQRDWRSCRRRTASTICLECIWTSRKALPWTKIAIRQQVVMTSMFFLFLQFGYPPKHSTANIRADSLIFYWLFEFFAFISNPFFL